MEYSRKDPFELSVLRIALFAGLISTLVSLILDKPEISGFLDLYIDLASTLLFMIALIMVWRQAPYRLILYAFFIPLISLLIVSLIIHDGLASSTEINAFGIVMLICLTMRNHRPFVFALITLVGVVASLYVVEQQHHFFDEFSGYSTNTLTIIIISISIILVTNYAKSVFERQRESLNRNRHELQEKAEEITLRNQQLQKQHQELASLKDSLEEKVQLRADELHRQNEAMEKYLRLTMIELITPYQNTLQAIQKLDPSDEKQELTERILTSGKRLEKEIKNLQHKLVNHDEE